MMTLKHSAASSLAQQAPGPGTVQVHNVVSYGARGDGSDATRAIRQALQEATKGEYRGVVYFPPGLYPHDGLVIDTQGVSLVGDGKRESVLSYTGAGDGVLIRGAGNVRLSDLQLHGSPRMTSGLRIVNAANTALHRVYLSGNGSAGDGIVLEGATYYALLDDCMIDGSGSQRLARGIAFRAAGETPNSNALRSVRIQECGIGVDHQAGNNNLLEAVRCELRITAGIRIGAGSRDTVIIAPRLDFSGTGITGIEVAAGASRTLILGPRYDIGDGGTALADNGAGTLQIDGEGLLKSPTVMRSVRVLDEADNPFIDLSTRAGQAALLQVFGGLLDVYSGHGLGMRFRTDGGTIVLEFGAGNRIGFFGSSPVARPTVAGESGDGATLRSLLRALDQLGLIHYRQR